MRIPKTRHPFPFWLLTIFPKHVLIRNIIYRMRQNLCGEAFPSLRAEITYKLINTN